MRLYVIANTSVGMSQGKRASQLIHGAVRAVLHMSPTRRREWLENSQPIVVLKADQSVLARILEDLSESAFAVYDDGLTQVPAGTLTCVSIDGDSLTPHGRRKLRELSLL